ncbi:hypothetical protein D918_00781 [Trichuris suis]|nr:hypothetical protein D918_00781 [Trichuris suis]
MLHPDVKSGDATALEDLRVWNEEWIATHPQSQPAFVNCNVPLQQPQTLHKLQELPSAALCQPVQLPLDSIDITKSCTQPSSTKVPFNGKDALLTSNYPKDRIPVPYGPDKITQAGGISLPCMAVQMNVPMVISITESSSDEDGSDRDDCSRTILAKHVPKCATLKEIVKFFRAAGELDFNETTGQLSVRILTKRGKPRGEVLVRYATRKQMQNAIAMFNGTCFPPKIRPMAVTMSKGPYWTPKMGDKGTTGSTDLEEVFLQDHECSGHHHERNAEKGKENKSYASKGRCSIVSGMHRFDKKSWLCLMCNNMNFFYRNACNTCFMQRGFQNAARLNEQSLKQKDKQKVKLSDQSGTQVSWSHCSSSSAGNDVCEVKKSTETRQAGFPSRDLVSQSEVICSDENGQSGNEESSLTHRLSPVLPMVASKNGTHLFRRQGDVRSFGPKSQASELLSKNTDMHDLSKPLTFFRDQWSVSRSQGLFHGSYAGTSAEVASYGHSSHFLEMEAYATSCREESGFRHLENQGQLCNNNNSTNSRWNRCKAKGQYEQTSHCSLNCPMRCHGRGHSDSPCSNSFPWHHQQVPSEERFDFQERYPCPELSREQSFHEGGQERRPVNFHYPLWEENRRWCAAKGDDSRLPVPPSDYDKSWKKICQLKYHRPKGQLPRQCDRQRQAVSARWRLHRSSRRQFENLEQQSRQRDRSSPNHRRFHSGRLLAQREHASRPSSSNMTRKA